MDGPFGPATQLLGQIHYELQRLAEIADENLSAQAQLPTVVAGLLPAPVVTEAGTLDLTPLLDVISTLRTQDNTPALAAVLVELQGLRQDFQDNLEQSRRQQAAQSMLGGPSGHVYVSDDVRVINGSTGLHVTVDSLPAGGASTDVTDRAARLLGHVTVDNASIPVTGSVSVSNLPATQPVSGSVSVSNFPATQPVSLATNTPDVTDRVGRLLGHVNVDNFPATQPVSGSVSVSNFPATQPVSIAGTVATTSAAVVRTPVTITLDAVSGITTEALATALVVNKAGVVSTAQTSYTVTGGKTLHIQSLSLAVQVPATVGCTSRLRLRSAASVLATSPIFAECKVGTSATAFAGTTDNKEFPDGLEIAGGQQIGFSHIESSTIAGSTTTGAGVSLCMVGYEY